MISSIPGSSVNTLAPYAPMGRAPVSQENSDLKSSSFKPTEQLAEVARGQNKRPPEDAPNQDAEQDRVGRAGTQSAGEGAAGAGKGDVANKASESVEEKERQQVERDQIQALAARDREVRAHEQAHAAIAGQHGGSPSYTYQRGPDGVSYAIGGEVSIDTSPIPGDPEATLRKAQQIQRAANAPADPSGQDRMVAAQAVQLEQEARIELQQQRAIESGQRQDVAQKEEGSESSAVSAKAGSALDTVGQQQEREAEAAKQDAEASRREEARFADEQLQLDQRRARAELFGSLGQKNIDLNRRLIEIGVIQSPSSLGSLLNQKA